MTKMICSEGNANVSRKRRIKKGKLSIMHHRGSTWAQGNTHVGWEGVGHVATAAHTSIYDTGTGWCGGGGTQIFMQSARRGGQHLLTMHSYVQKEEIATT